MKIDYNRSFSDGSKKSDIRQISMCSFSEQQRKQLQDSVSVSECNYLLNGYSVFKEFTNREETGGVQGATHVELLTVHDGQMFTSATYSAAAWRDLKENGYPFEINDVVKLKPAVVSMNRTVSVFDKSGSERKSDMRDIQFDFPTLEGVDVIHRKSGSDYTEIKLDKPYEFMQVRSDTKIARNGNPYSMISYPDENARCLSASRVCDDKYLFSEYLDARIRGFESVSSVNDFPDTGHNTVFDFNGSMKSGKSDSFGKRMFLSFYNGRDGDLMTQITGNRTYSMKQDGLFACDIDMLVDNINKPSVQNALAYQQKYGVSDSYSAMTALQPIVNDNMHDSRFVYDYVSRFETSNAAIKHLDDILNGPDVAYDLSGKEPEDEQVVENKQVSEEKNISTDFAVISDDNLNRFARQDISGHMRAQVFAMVPYNAVYNEYDFDHVRFLPDLGRPASVRNQVVVDIKGNDDDFTVNITSKQGSAFGNGIALNESAFSLDDKGNIATQSISEDERETFENLMYDAGIPYNVLMPSKSSELSNPLPGRVSKKNADISPTHIVVPMSAELVKNNNGYELHNFEQTAREGKVAKPTKSNPNPVPVYIRADVVTRHLNSFAEAKVGKDIIKQEEEDTVGMTDSELNAYLVNKSATDLDFNNHIESVLRSKKVQFGAGLDEEKNMLETDKSSRVLVINDRREGHKNSDGLYNLKNGCQTESDLSKQYPLEVIKALNDVGVVAYDTENNDLKPIWTEPKDGFKIVGEKVFGARSISDDGKLAKDLKRFGYSISVAEEKTEENTKGYGE